MNLLAESVCSGEARCLAQSMPDASLAARVDEAAETACGVAE